MPARKWDLDVLPGIVSESISVREVILKLGLQPFSGNWATVKKYIDRLNLDTTHFVKGRNRNSHYQIEIPLEFIMVEHSTYSTYKLKLRLFKEGMKEKKCECCGLEEWLGRPAPLALNHINGIKTDHRFHNLEILCYNCHGLTSTFGGRNKRS